MTTPKREVRSDWPRVVAACGVVLLLTACTPAEKSAAVPIPQSAPPAQSAAAAPIVTATPAEPVAPAPAPPAAAPVVTRPSAAPPPAPAPAAPAAVTPVRVGLPAGPGRETVQQVCASCHAIGMVTANGRTSDGWAEIIERMMGLGMEASDEDLQTVHAYLTREFPPRSAN